MVSAPWIKLELTRTPLSCCCLVTEKLADTLKLSAVPIIDGPSSYTGYLPNERSAIRMDAYPDPRELAEYIRFLDTHDDAYLAYLKHRQDALFKSPTERLDPLFVSLWSDQTAHDYRVSWCSICRHMASTWRSRHTSNYLAVDEQEAPKEDGRFLIDSTCMAEGKWSYATNGAPYNTYSWTPTPKDEFAYHLDDSNNSNNHNNNNDDLPPTNISTLQDRIGMLVLVSLGVPAIGFLIYTIYRQTKKYRRYRKQSSSPI